MQHRVLTFVILLTMLATANLADDPGASPATDPGSAKASGEATWAGYETRPARVTPLVDFSGIQKDLAGEPTRVLVLGTAHLSQLPEEAFVPEHLALLLERLEAFAPDVIAIEAIGGRTCDHLRRWTDLYDGVADRYCSDPGDALEGLEMTTPEAAVAAEAALVAIEQDASPAKRRRLAALLFGAGEVWSGVLQWSRLKPKSASPATV